MSMNRKELTQRVRVMGRMLKAKAPRLLRKHMGELENMLSSPKAPVKEVANAGLIPLVAKHLLSSDRKLAASAVHAIASITYKCSTSVMKAGCVGKLVELVCDEDSEIARNAIFALSNLAVDFQGQLLSNGALKQILSRLRQIHEPNNKKCWMLWADAMRLITNLVNITDKDDNCTKEMVKKTLKHKGDRQELIRVLKVSLKGKDQVDVVEDALRGILSLAKLHVCKHCGIPQLLDMEIIPLLTNQFNHSCFKIKKLAVDCIQDVVYNSVLDVSKCRPSPIQPLKELMHNPNQELSTCAALVLSNIACEGEQAIEALKAVGLFEAMVSLLLNPNTSTELKTEAAWFVINVCGSGARRHLEEIVELGAVHGLSRWVLKQQKDTKMVEETVAALRSVCDILLPKPEQIARYHHRQPQIDANAAGAIPGPSSPPGPVLSREVATHAQVHAPAAEISVVSGMSGGRRDVNGREANASEIKLQSMLPEEEALDLVSAYVGAAKVLAHFEVSDGVYPSALETLERIKNGNHAAMELLDGPLAGGSQGWLARLSPHQLEGILEHLTGRRPYDADDKVRINDSKISENSNEASRGLIARSRPKSEQEAREMKGKMVAVLSHAIQNQLQSKLLAHYNQVQRCEREKELHQHHGSINWTVDVMHPSNIKQTKLTSNHFDCGDLKCHVLLYPWGNPNRPEAHKTHLSVYVAVLDIEKSSKSGSRNQKNGNVADFAASGNEGVPGRFKLTIVNQVDSNKSVSKGGQHTFTELASDRGFAQMIPLKELLQVGKGFIVEGKISIKAEITLSVSHGSVVGPLQSLPRSRKQNSNRRPRARNSPSLPPPAVPSAPSVSKKDSGTKTVGSFPPKTDTNPHLSALVGGGGANPAEYIEVPAADIPKSMIKLRAGLKVDCRDEFGMWLEASIIRVEAAEKYVHVHYNKWGKQWDQWISTRDEIGRHCFGNFQTCSGPRPATRTETGGKCPNPDFHHHHHHHHHHHNPHRHAANNIRSRPPYVEKDNVRVYILKPLPRRWIKGIVDKVRHQQVQVRYEVDNKKYEYWFHMDHGEVQKLDAANIDMKDFQLTPQNEKIIREWRADKVSQWENKGKLAQKYRTRELLELWLDAQCLKARQQLFKKQRKESTHRNDSNVNENINSNSNAATGNANEKESNSGNQPKVQGSKNRRRNRKQKNQDTSKTNSQTTHQQGKTFVIGNDSPVDDETPNVIGERMITKGDDDVFKDIDLDRIDDFEKVALSEKQNAKNRKKAKFSKKKSNEPLDLPMLMSSHRVKTETLKKLRARLSKLSQKLAQVMVSNQGI
eukprot:CAMPEP_0114499760 /NCGR_PEP_ID=MMETSP0109-20121206/7595_1 /TAXON_ID=29199 /ORGANISM="Chlorarachnion reptans, Strain CCCM449" /LENGTH=1303 /DNA_ID=CAMNT_0001677361 /DNA_START=136 /DNA_END=4047 /DNA_ORIENTATION=+